MQPGYHKVAAGLIVLLFFTVTPTYAQTFLTGRFSAAQETHDVTSEASGTAAVVVTDEGVRFLVTVNGLSGPITAAHFHQGAAGTNGPPVRTIIGDFTGTSASGVWTASDDEPLTDDLVQALLAGNLYLNVHTDAYGGGEIRAQLHPSSGAGLTANLTTAQAGVSGDASGTAAIQVTDAGVLFHVTVSGLSGDITAAHFHQGAAGTNGGPVRTISGDFTGTTALGLWTATDTEALTDEMLSTLLLGGLYLNIHTAANPGGEIRGQVSLNSGWGLSANLDADQAGTTASASGTAALTFTDTGVAFRVTVEGLSGDITAAHFHRGAAGTNGGPVRTISDDFTGSTASGLWTASDSEPLTDDLIRDLLAGNLYLNIHTADNPGGEIRGQVLLNEGTSLRSSLTAAQAGTSVDAAGTATVTLTDAGAAFEVTVDGLSGAITAAHFHRGAAGTNGGPVRTISDDFASRVVTLAPSMDNTLYEDGSGMLSNGGGMRIFAGRSNQAENSIRRGLIAFDVAGAIPAGAVIESVALSMDLVQTQIGAQTIGLHRVEAAWGEGTSAGAMGEGGGAAATTDDATWVHTFFDTETWTTPGGDFAATPSATMEVDAAGAYVWTSTPELVADVQAWVDDPSVNFGWLLAGNEDATQTAKAFSSREGDNPPTLTITYSAPSATASGLWTASDSEPLTDDLIQDLLAGNLYLNIHTADNPGGEIRGQVLLSSGAALHAMLTAAQAGVESDASGTATVQMTAAGAAFQVTVDGLSGDITAAHFHRGAAGTNGGPVRTISGDFTGSTASGLWTASDSEPLTDDLIRDLLAGNLYLNIHTADNPGGEIRGQVRVGGGIGAAVQLDPGQQPQGATADATGTAALTLTDTGLLFDLTVTNLSGAITAAHFHQGTLGQNGGPVRTITEDFSGNTASGLWMASDGEPLTDDLVLDLLAGNLYLNVHTPDNPGGEIRGQVNADGVVLTAIERAGEETPEAFTLSQNYPNPFNPATTIEFSMSQASHAVLKVFNLLGQDVATLVDDQLAAGTYRTTFDAAHLPSGVYFYQLEAGGRQFTKRMLLLK